jgi:hypothetical protein
MKSNNSLISHYKLLFSNDNGVSIQEIQNIEKKLEIILPKDFKDISTCYRGGLLGGMSLLTIDDDGDNHYGIIHLTLSFRKQSLIKKDYLVLMYDSPSIVFLNCQTGYVYYISEYDLDNLLKDQELMDDPTVFKSYANFFQYLLDEEEKIRKEESSN